jgi:hypothetical protein
MASKAKHQQQTAISGGGLVTRLCSINSNGLVFLSSSRLEVSSDVTLAVQTSAPGVSHEWVVHGWVVDCRLTRCRNGLRYKVTLLFHDLPAGLKCILTEGRAVRPQGFPPLRHAPIFGMN